MKRLIYDDLSLLWPLVTALRVSFRIAFNVNIEFPVLADG